MNWFKPSKKASSNIWGMNSSKSTVKKKQSQSIYPRQLKQSKKSKPFSGVNLIVRLTQRRIGLQRSEYDYNYKKPEEKVRQLAVVNVKTGDIDTFQESSKWGKLAIEKERASYGGDPEKYYPLSELHRTQESSNIEVLNPSPIDLIRAKREKLREEARMEGIDVSGEFDKYPSKETVDAFMKVTKEQPIPEPEIIERAEPEPIRPPFKYEVVEPEPPEPEAKVYESIEEMPDLPEEEPSEAQELLDESANETEDKS